MVNTREKERRVAKRGGNEGPADITAELPSKRLRIKVPEANKTMEPNTEDKLSAGLFGDAIGWPKEENKNEEDLDKLDYDEIVNDPDAALDASPEPGEPESKSESSDSEKDPQVFEVTYLMPKAESAGTTPIKLSTRSSFTTFQRRVAECLNVTTLNNYLVSYKFNNRPAKERPQCLDTLVEYQHMLYELCTILESPPAKKGPLPVNIFCSKREETPEQVPVLAKKKGSKASKGRMVETATNNPDAGGEENPNGSGNWKIIRQLREEHACTEHKSHCFVGSDGNHYEILAANLALWATVIARNRATIIDPPPQIKQSLLDWSAKTQGKSTASVGEALILPAAPAIIPPAPAVAPQPTFGAPMANFLGDPLALAAFVSAITTAVRQPAPPPAPVQPPPRPLSPVEPTPDHIDYPLIKDWLESIVDLHPRLNGFERVNELVLPELTYGVLMGLTGINFVDATLLLRRAKEVVRQLVALPK
ncbi:hypothetical protein BDV93DRAFT_587718 [Ceratobasidium sp. AG-I]|nr:hypothetical protein BDV93DRAFT_587718 [Ceratobasidium sp. AG-I]